MLSMTMVLGSKRSFSLTVGTGVWCQRFEHGCHRQPMLLPVKILAGKLEAENVLQQAFLLLRSLRRL